jgi:pimeloyl-CoA synthetase
LTGAKNVVQCSRMNQTTTATIVKRGRGRPAGSTSFVNVSLADLDQFVGTKSAIPVSRVWLQKMGLAIQPISRSITEVNDSDSSPKVEFKITKL